MPHVPQRRRSLIENIPRKEEEEEEDKGKPNKLVGRTHTATSKTSSPYPPRLFSNRACLLTPQDVETLSRSHSFCGFTGTTSFPGCEDVIDCFDEHKSLQAWSHCMEDNIHADMHGWLGGAWGCNVREGRF